jgi:hypothetical protein
VAYADVISAIDTVVTDGEDGQGGDKPTKRGGRRAAVECACQPPASCA